MCKNPTCTKKATLGGGVGIDTFGGGLESYDEIRYDISRSRLLLCRHFINAATRLENMVRWVLCNVSVQKYPIYYHMYLKGEISGDVLPSNLAAVIRKLTQPMTSLARTALFSLSVNLSLLCVLFLI